MTLEEIMRKSHPALTAEQIEEEVGQLPPGELAVARSSVRVGTATRALELGQVQPQGKKQMAAADWARGVTFDEPAVLGS